MEKETKFCSNCGAEIDINAEICPKCGVRVGAFITRDAPIARKNPMLAAILSFLWAGLGQFYNGDIGKGFIFSSITFISWIFIMSLLPVLLIPFWVYAIYDAYAVAKKINTNT